MAACHLLHLFHSGLGFRFQGSVHLDGRFVPVQGLGFRVLSIWMDISFQFRVQVLGFCPFGWSFRSGLGFQGFVHLDGHFVPVSGFGFCPFGWTFRSGLGFRVLPIWMDILFRFRVLGFPSGLGFWIIQGPEYSCRIFLQQEIPPTCSSSFFFIPPTCSSVSLRIPKT